MAESTQLLNVSKPWHEELATFLIANPQLTMGKVAGHFNVSASWLSVVKNSDAFKDYYEAQRAEVQSMVNVDLADKVHALAELGIEQLTETLVERANGKEGISLDSVVTVTDLALKSLGFGGKKPVNGGLDMEGAKTLMIVSDQQALAIARQHLDGARKQADVDLNKAKDVTPTSKEEVIEHEPASPPSSSVPPAD